MATLMSSPSPTHTRLVLRLQARREAVQVRQESAQSARWHTHTLTSPVNCPCKPFLTEPVSVFCLLLAGRAYRGRVCPVHCHSLHLPGHTRQASPPHTARAKFQRHPSLTKPTPTTHIHPPRSIKKSHPHLSPIPYPRSTLHTIPRLQKDLRQVSTLKNPLPPTPFPSPKRAGPSLPAGHSKQRAAAATAHSQALPQGRQQGAQGVPQHCPRIRAMCSHFIPISLYQ